MLNVDRTKITERMKIDTSVRINMYYLLQSKEINIIHDRTEKAKYKSKQ